MKKKLNVFYTACMLIAIVFCFSGCGSDNTPVSKNIDNPENVTASSTMDTIKIEDIAWNVNEGIVDGERYVLLDYINNSKFTISSLEITFKEKQDLTEEEKTTFFADIQKMFEFTDDDIAQLKEIGISMYSNTIKVVNPGESAKNVYCYYYSSYYYLTDINHYNLVEPDIATVKYIDNDKIYTAYYDFVSKKYTVDEKTETAYFWTQSELGNKIPKPDVKIVESSSDDEEIFMFDAYGLSFEQFNAYVNECKKLGYTVDESSYEGFYSADNVEGYNVYLYYDEDDYMMSGTIEVLDRIDEPDEAEDYNAVDEITAEETIVEETTENPAPSVDGISPEFKEAMDSYEAFFDEYANFMKKYQESEDITSMLTDYVNYMTQYTETMEKMNALNGDEMSAAELLYYAEVTTRITNKLIDIA